MNAAPKIPGATVSGSAPGRTMAASLPPSSSVIRLIVSAALAITFLPVSDEPVKLILAMSGWAVIRGPRSFWSVMMLTTPAGNTFAMISPTLSVVSGVVGAGLMTIVLPASSASGALNAISRIGKFHGMIAPTTPSGRRYCSTSLVSLSSITFTGRSRGARWRMK